MKHWQKPKNKGELKPGIRARVVTFDKGLISQSEARIFRRLVKDKKTAGAIIAQVESAKWAYGQISDSRKVLNMDSGGMLAIPPLKMIEIYVDKPAMKGRFDFAGPSQIFERIKP